MSLDWNLTKIENREEVCWEKDENGNDKLNPVTESLIWLTMGIGMGSITEENEFAFYSRIADTKRVEVPITPADIHQHIGLTTNVSKESDASFRKRIVENFTREQKRKFDFEISELENVNV